MLRQLISRWGIMSIEMQQGFVQDSKFVQVENGSFVTVDEPAAEPPAAEEAPEPPAPAEVQTVNMADL